MAVSCKRFIAQQKAGSGAGGFWYFVVVVPGKTIVELMQQI